LVITHMFKCDCIDPVFFHRRGRKARREGLFDYLCDLCALSGEMWVITRVEYLDNLGEAWYHIMEQYSASWNIPHREV